MSIAQARPLPARKSLRARGLLATLALLAYLIACGSYLAWERDKIRQSISELTALARHEKAVALAEAAVNGALVDVSETSSAEVAAPAPPSELRLYMETSSRLLVALEEFDPGHARLQRAVARSYGALLAQPVRANWIDMRESLKRTSDELEIRRRRLAEERDALTQAWQRHYDAVTIDSLLLAGVGLVVFGALAAWFFTALAGDIHRLEAHARQIVRGVRGVALDVQREDELGRLMHAVNRMSADLDEREQQIRLDAERRSHQDKMLSVGALAAGVAHEVNNPLAVIGGVAQELRATPGDASRVAQGVELILAQTQRAAQAARQLAEVAAPQPADLDWIDLNALTHRVVQLIGYDKRYRRIAFDVATDPHLPAVRSSAGAIQQLLMQLLPLVGDALAKDPTLQPRVRIETAIAAGVVEWQMLFAATLDFTQPDVQRALLLSRAIIEPLQGRLALGQVAGSIQRIKVSLPAVCSGSE